MSATATLSPEEKFNEYLTDKRPCPPSGRHSWIAAVSLVAVCTYGLEDEDLIESMIDAVLTREKRPNEIRDAIRSAKRKCAQDNFGFSEFRHVPKWPKRNPAAVEAVVSAPNAPCSLEFLENCSMWFFEGKSVDAEAVIDHLFPGNSLLCCGRSQSRFDTRTREKWRGKLSEMQFIVPSAMSALKGRKKNTKRGQNPMSAHTEDNTGPRQRIVIEFDKDEHGRIIPVSEQCSVLWHLNAYLPLIMVVHSGGKSCQGWFECRDETEEALMKFMRYAVSLGADPAGWKKSQFFRMPGGLRDNGERQAVHYFEPEAMNQRRMGAAAVSAVAGEKGQNEVTRSLDVALSDQLNSVEGFLCKFIAFGSSSQAPIIALWIAHAHTIDAFDFTPYLNVRSPVKRCGKSLTLDAIKLLVPRPWFAVSPSEAVVYRKIEADMPTLLLDEVDTVFIGGRDENKEGLRALLNAGFNRSATVPRCTGPHFEITEFRVFCPKIIAGIGMLPDTVADRSIPIVLARKTKGQVVERFRTRDAAPAAEIIRESLATWATSAKTVEALRSARPSMPEALNDRQSDICEPLLAIADAAGGEWPQRARTALIQLFGGSEANDENLGVRLLSAIRDAFTQSGTDKLSTDEILESLLNCDGAPWVSWWEKEIARGNMRGPATRLASMLKPFGISSGTIRKSDGSTPKGYKAESFADAWERYL